jgi:hypothetical protein
MSHTFTIKPRLLIFLLLFGSHVVAERTFFSVNILKTIFSTTPHALSTFLDQLNLMLDNHHPASSSESPPAPFDPVSCACGSFGALDPARSCGTPSISSLRYHVPKIHNAPFFQLSRPDIRRPDSHSRQQRTIPRLSSRIFRSARAVPAQPLILRRPFPRRAQRRYHSVDTAPAASLFFITSFIQLRAVVPGSRRPSHCEQLYSPGTSAPRHFGPLYSLRDADSCRRFPALYRF